MKKVAKSLLIILFIVVLSGCSTNLFDRDNDHIFTDLTLSPNKNSEDYVNKELASESYNKDYNYLNYKLKAGYKFNQFDEISIGFVRKGYDREYYDVLPYIKCQIPFALGQKFVLVPVFNVYNEYVYSNEDYETARVGFNLRYNYSSDLIFKSGVNAVFLDKSFALVSKVGFNYNFSEDLNLDTDFSYIGHDKVDNSSIFNLESDEDEYSNAYSCEYKLSYDISSRYQLSNFGSILYFDKFDGKFGYHIGAGLKYAITINISTELRYYNGYIENEYSFRSTTDRSDNLLINLSYVGF